MENKGKKQNQRRVIALFKPNRKFIDLAVDKYMKKGGRITRVFVDNNSYQSMMASKNKLFEADDYLAG